MSKLNDDWFYAFRGCFETKEDVIEFIFEHLNIDNFEDIHIDMGGFGDPNECFKVTKEDKKQILYDFMMGLIQ